MNESNSFSKQSIANYTDHSQYSALTCQHKVECVQQCHIFMQCCIFMENRLETTIIQCDIKYYYKFVTIRYAFGRRFVISITRIS